MPPGPHPSGARGAVVLTGPDFVTRLPSMPPAPRLALSLRSGIGGLLAALFLVALPLAASSCRPGEETPPSIILVTVDTLRADRLGCYGHPGAGTPMIDRLAAEGQRFEQVVATTPLTLPSHASLLTGRIPPAHGVRHNALFRLLPGEITLAEMLREAGYRTGAVLGAAVLNAEYGLDQGFEHYDDLPLGRARQGLPPERSAEEVTRRALAWLKEQPGRPVFLWVHYYDPHAPYAPPPQLRSRFPDPYDGEVAAVDAALRTLVQGLPEAKLPAGETVIAITADHGESLGEHGEGTHGFFVYQASLRIPLVLFGPGRIPRGEVRREPVALVDVAPTLLGLAGLAPPPGIDGIDLLDGDAAPSSAGRPLYFESRAPLFDHGWAPLAGFRRADQTYILAPRPEIYDLSQDPGELNNLARERPDEEARLREELQSLISRRSRSGEQEAARTVDADEAEALRALGYLAGTASPEPHGDAETGLADPKDRVDEMRATFEAVNSMGSGRPAEAVRLLRGVLDEDPGNVTASLLLAQALVAAGRTEQAVSSLDRAIDVAASPAIRGQLLKVRGLALKSAGRYAEAVESYRAAEREVPLDRASAIELAGAELAAGHPERAREVLAEALRHSPEDTEVLATAADHAWRRGQAEEAREYAERMLALAPDHAAALIVLGNLENEAGRPAEARAFFERALESSPGSGPAKLGLARSLRATGDREGAAALLDELVAAHPGEAEYRVERARLALERGDAAAARRDLERALALDPSSEAASVLLESVP